MGVRQYKSLLVIALLGLAACGDKGSSFSIPGTSQSFRQQSSSAVNNKIDLLWVVDNSASMDPLQQNMTTNFNSFISQFTTKGFDFHLAVTTTDTYLADAAFNNNPSLAQFRDGVGGTHTGIFDILSTTPNLINVFVTNATQGANGSGDERAFSSMRSALNSNLNTGFLRTDSYFAVIILSDEDDFSSATRKEYSWLYAANQGGVPDHDYNYSGLDTTDSYVSYLDTLTGTTGDLRRYSVSAITVLDQNCLTQHQPQSPSAIIGQRYIDIAGQTKGVTGSVCDASYANSLNNIQQNILELGTQFYLKQIPIESTITVAVDGASVAMSSTDGWTYVSAANSIMFHGAAVPSASALISINFQPSGLNF